MQDAHKFKVPDKAHRDAHRKQVREEHLKRHGLTAKNCIPEEYLNIINEAKNNYLTNIHKDNLHTFRKAVPVLNEFFLTLTDESELKKYVPKPVNTSSIHLGQVKLILREWLIVIIEMFRLWGEGRLTLSGEPYGACDRKIVFVYAGAANGEHMKQLNELMPLMTYELYDVNPFHETLFDPKYKGIFNFHHQLFLDEDAIKIREKFRSTNNVDDYVIIFVSDIRAAKPRQDPAQKVENDIERDMIWQNNWFRLTDADFCVLKFRAPYMIDEREPPPFSYPDGDLYFQYYHGAISTEMGLCARKNCPDKMYVPIQIEFGNFFHNEDSRMDLYPHPYSGLYGIDYCYDCHGLIHTCALHLSMVKQGFPFVSNKWRNIREMLDWLMPPYIYRKKLIRLHRVDLTCTFAHPEKCYFIKQNTYKDTSEAGTEYIITPVCDDIIWLIDK